MKSYLQRMGRSLQLPIAVLPAAALLEGIGHFMPKNWAIAQFLMAGGTGILNILALLFAAGLAIGMSENHDGASALAGVVSYFTVNAILSPATVALILKIKTNAVNPAFKVISGNVFIGIISGLIAAALYNRFHNTKLPAAFAFFSGKRLVPIVSVVVMLLVSIILLFVWPFAYNGLVIFGKTIMRLGAVGAGLYALFNRLLIPTGLHQALNAVFWFNVAGINDLGKFWLNAGVKGITGMYMGGFFPVMMFGLPAGALAIYHNARSDRKKETASLMLAAAFSSFFTGVTEPLEFSFMFVAWPLYIIHAVLTGLSVAFAAWMHWTAGFTFSAGLVDFILSSHMPIANKPYMLIVQGLVMAVIYYFVFDFAIKKFNLMTPGRQPITADSSNSNEAQAASKNDTNKTDKNSIQAAQIYRGLGGYQNLKKVDYCTTRLRLQLKNTAKIDHKIIESAHVAAINPIDKTNLQIIIGTDVEFTAEALEKLRKKHTKLNTIKQTNITNIKTSAKPGLKGTDNFYTPISGKFIPIEAVNDKTFAEKMLGDGYAVVPSTQTVVAPVDGKITTIFPTKHAVGLTTKHGLEVLVHIGIDTVELKGKPFDVKVKQGQEVKHGTPLVNIDLPTIKAAGKDPVTMVIITNMNQVGYLKIANNERTIDKNKEVMQAILK